jgi:molybdopterin/thiamine biosynthesis adenylyltransferase
MQPFSYNEAFIRNIGWVTGEEQAVLHNKRVAVGGLGGVGGSHLITLTRLGVGKFNIADLDTFQLPNFNRQYGAAISTLDQPKLDVMKRTVLDINPELDLRTFEHGIDLNNVDQFLDGVDLYMDSLDIFAVDIRRKVFQRCYDLGIPAITAAPMGMGTAFLVFLPGKMSFEDYFCLEGLSLEDQIIRFIVGVSPSMQQRHYLVAKSGVNILKQKVPSTCIGIELAAGVACAQAIKILLGRGKVIHAPRGLHFDAYRNSLAQTWRPLGNRNPLQKYMFWRIKRLLRGA